MPEFLARLTRGTIARKGELDALLTEANRAPAEVFAEQLGPTRPAGLGWPTLRWARTRAGAKQYQTTRRDLKCNGKSRWA